MDYLIEAAKEYGLEDLAQEFLKHDSVHGILIDLDPLWLRAYALHLKYPNRKIDLNLIDPIFWEDTFVRHPLIEHWNDTASSYFETAIPINMQWYPGGWYKESNNIRVRIQLRPGSTPVEITEKTSMQVIQEHSAVPEFSSFKARKYRRPLQGGISVGQGGDEPGTLGGILIDRQSGQKYGLTCGHVIKELRGVEQPSNLDSRKSAVIGTCVYNDLPKPSAGQLCNPFLRSLNKMDIALIEIDSQTAAQNSILNVGSVKGVMPSSFLHPNLKIEYNGRSSGHEILVTGGIFYSQEIVDSNGEKYCFSNLIELKQPSFFPLCLKRPVRGGDSGAWIIGNGTTGLEWCGMIIAENRQSGYAIRAEDILMHLSDHGYNLET